MRSDQARALFEGGWRGSHHFLEEASGAPLFGEQELFDIFLSARDGSGPGAIFLNYEVEKGVYSRQRGEPTPIENMPSATDASFRGYTERMRRTFGGARYCLRINEAQAYSAQVWKRCCELLLPLEHALRDAEIPPCIRTTTFVGDYDYTPFGVHVDPYPQIQCVTTGSRTALFWDSSYWASLGAQDRLEPWKHLEAAHRLPMRGGDAAYWPTGQEHAFSSAEGFAIAITFSFPTVVPESAEQAAERRSAHQFLHIPAPRPSPEWHADQLFRGDPILPLEIVSEADGETVLVAAGSTFKLSCPSPFAPFVARVNGREPFRAADMMSDLGLPESDARELLDVFYSRHCFDAFDAV